MKRRNRGAPRGYTLVELLMSLFIFSIGVSGVMAMQKVTVTSNQHARDLAVATQIAQAWVSQLQTDAIAWNQPSASNPTDDLGDTRWLSNVSASNKNWILPSYEQTRGFGPAFDVRGQPLDTSKAGSLARVKFCTHIRLSWLYNPTVATTTMRGGGLMRAEVRVFWLRDGAAAPDNKPICGNELPPNNVNAASGLYHFVYEVSAVRENTTT